MHTDLIELVTAIPAMDEIGEGHRAHALTWLRGTDDVYRRVKPATPDPHLVAYVLVVDRRTRSVLLGDHRLAGLWLPIGGHVEQGEAPASTAAREAVEELGAALPFDASTGDRPFLLTVTETTGDPTARHTDVSLWFAVEASAETRLAPDVRELRSVRWWSADRLRSGDPAGFEPHLARALRQLGL